MIRAFSYFCFLFCTYHVALIPEPHHFLDRLAIVASKVNVDEDAPLLVVFMAVAHLVLYSFQLFLQFFERERGVGVCQQVEETGGANPHRLRPQLFSEDNIGEKAAQSGLGFGHVLLLLGVGTDGKCNLHSAKVMKKVRTTGLETERI